MAKQATNPDFWTDVQQAQERIGNTFIMLDDIPVRVDAIYDKDNYGYEKHRLALTYPEGKTAPDGGAMVDMDDERWRKFRTLPPLGWVNYYGRALIGAVYLSRTARNTRQHGLNSQNVAAYDFNSSEKASGALAKSSNVSADLVFRNAGYVECCDGEYPPLEEILTNLKENTAIAYSPKFAVFRCSDGVRWLYRKKNRVGMFVGADTLSLFPRLGFYREEIMGDPAFTLTKIQEF